MATYKEIKGVTLQTLDSDPVVNVGSWAAGGSMNTGRSELGGAGIQTAAIAMGGKTPGTDFNAIVEIYDGSSWTETGDLNTARKMGGGNGAGTTTAALAFGGRKSPSDTNTGETESWNGSSWTEVNDLNTARGQLGGSGATYTAAIAAGGGTPSATAVTETWNGSSWTEVNDLNNSRRNLPVSGTTTAAIAGGGEDGPNARIESWDGSSWTEIAEANTSRNSASMSCNGSNTATIYFGGYTSTYVTNTEDWNGTAWTEVNDLATAKGYAAGTGTSTLAFSFGGEPGSHSTTEEWAFPPPTAAILNEGMAFLSGGTNLKVFGTDVGVATATWASGANLSNARAMNAGIGSTNAALSLGGNAFGGPYPVTVEQYDGSSWTEIAEFNTGRAYLAGMGTITSGLVCNGVDTAPPVFNTGKTEEWNGSSWTEKNDLGTARYRAGLVGYSATAGLCFGGFNLSEPYPPPASDFAGNESWDGTSWTEVSDLNTARGCSAGAGIQTAALCMGGYAPPTGTPKGVAVEQWDGTSWTEIAETSTNKRGRGGSGAVSRAIVFGGQTSPQNLTEMWNGSSWSEIADLSAGRYLAGSGSLGAVASFQSNGEEPGDSVKFEEFEADAALSTVTVS